MVDLEDLSLKELKELQNRVTKAIATYEERKRREALLKLEETARAMGFSLQELTARAATLGRKRAPAVPKYANPGDPAQTWSGRGRKPKWMVDALKAGKSPDDLLI